MDEKEKKFITNPPMHPQKNVLLHMYRKEWLMYIPSSLCQTQIYTVKMNDEKRQVKDGSYFVTQHLNFLSGFFKLKTIIMAPLDC